MKVLVATETQLLEVVSMGNSSGNTIDGSHPWDLVGRTVRARRTIRQSPLSGDPDVPAGTLGSCVDYDGCGDPTYFVDFGAPYGTVLCEPTEIEE